jgi:hypothetical protein
MPQLPPAAPSPSGLPVVRIESAAAAELKRDWPAREAEEALRRSFPDGRLIMLVERHPTAGYSVRAPRYGHHLVSADGALVRSARPRVAAWRWERLLFAQVLPLAAALRGRELFHASAVELGGQALAFVGLSGAGKSSVAAHAVARGAGLVTDDVLAVEPSGDAVLAHSGTRLVGLDPRELATLERPAEYGTHLGQSEKTYLDVAVAEGPSPLAALYFLTGTSSPALTITPSAETPSRLLGASFLAYLADPEHLVRHLDVCSAIATRVPTFDVLVPRSVPAARVADSVVAHGYALACGAG